MKTLHEANVKPQGNEQDYITFYLSNIEPKIEELIAAQTKVDRAKIQREIITLIEDAGYPEGVTRMKALFNF